MPLHFETATFQVLELRAELVALQKQSDERNALHEREVKRAKQASDRTADMYRCSFWSKIELLDILITVGSRMLCCSDSGEMTGQELAPVPTRFRIFKLLANSSISTLKESTLAAFQATC